jgi:hypothetical protein
VDSGLDCTVSGYDYAGGCCDELHEPTGFSKNVLTRRITINYSRRFRTMELQLGDDELASGD